MKNSHLKISVGRLSNFKRPEDFCFSFPCNPSHMHMHKLIPGYIPVGCVPPASVAVSEGEGGVEQGGVGRGGELSVQGGCLLGE